jgi:hypothetical protein
MGFICFKDALGIGVNRALMQRQQRRGFIPTTSLIGPKIFVSPKEMEFLTVWRRYLGAGAVRVKVALGLECFKRRPETAITFAPLAA